MARPSRTGGKTSKAKASNASPAKGRKTVKTNPKIAAPASLSKRRSTSGPREQPDSYFEELEEAREQQAASAEILRVINSSKGDLTPVFDIILEKAHSLCDVPCGSLQLFDDNHTRAVAVRGMSEPFEQFLRQGYRLDRSQPVQSGRPFQIDDLAKVIVGASHGSALRVAFELGGLRTVLSVPLVRDGVVFGRILAGRQEVRPFSEHQIVVLQSFADQAVIAIENARLFNEVQAKTRDLRESLQQQTATAEVLKVISRSAFDLEAVLNTLVRSAVTLSGARTGTIFQKRGELYHLTAEYGYAPGTMAYGRANPIPPGVGSNVGRTAMTGSIVQMPDVLADPDFTSHGYQRLGNFRAMLGVPLKRDGKVEGVFSLTKPDPGPFEPRHVELVQTFADQAVIAIENVRLFDEVQAKTRDLSEALKYQTGSANILKTIASSPTDVGPVLKAIVESACELCEAYDAIIALKDGNELALRAHHGPIAMNRERWPNHRTSLSGRAIADRAPVHLRDVLSDEGAEFPIGQEMSRLDGVRSMLSVPMIRDDDAIGTIVLRRIEVNPFSDKQVQLLQTFADQAVIAIENTRRFNETRETLEQQTATADILKVIVSSPGDVAPVFDAMLENATRLCEASHCHVWRFDGQLLHAVAVRGDPWFTKWLQEHSPVAPIPGSAADRIARGEDIVHVADRREEEAYSSDPVFRDLVDASGVRASLSVALRRHGTLLGMINVYRQEVRAFSDKQIALLQNFAAQAVIAMENARLFNETKEALERQTATADVLKVISRSSFNLEPVLETLVESAAKLCQSDKGFINLRDGDLYRYAVNYGFSSEFEEYAKQNPMSPGRDTITGRAILEGKTIHIPDVLADLEYAGFGFQARGHYRSSLGVPLLRGGEAIGVFALTRSDVRPFTDKQIELVSTFADQAVIAIENARLFEEVKARTDDLSESLQQQTATADVLKIINRSSVDLETVLDTLVDTVARLCRADQATMFQRRDDKYHLVAAHGLSAEAKEFVVTHPVTADRGTLSGRVTLERRAVHVPNVLEDPEYSYREGQKVVGYRTLLGIPLLREESLIGIFTLNRTRVEPFTDKEIELATSFADQAVIAIENARLFDELRERQAELRVTFDNMGDGVVMFDATARLTACNRNFQEMLDLPDAFIAGRPNYAEYFRYLAERGEYSSDLEAELSRTIEDTNREMRLERTRPDGRVIEARRNPVAGGGFVLIYSDITERKRAEEAIRTARDAAETALRDLQTAQDRLVQTEKLASLGQLTAGIAHEIKNPLNFVNNFSALSAELTEELNDTLKPVAMDDKVRGEVDELTGLLKSNLEKVVQHGKRANSIVKNMLLHSREGSREHRPADINSLLDESLNLAYHGARAEKGEFNITLQRDFDADAGTIEVFPQEITRAFLNLIANGVYAATRRKNENKEPGFGPTLRATTKNLGATVEIRIRDNGTGIPAEVQEKMFNPFFTTKPAGEGTGLGLSMTHDIIVKQHGGRIDVATEPGQFTEFTIVLPRKSNVSGRD